MKDLSCSGENPWDPQLNEGDKLYTSHLKPTEISSALFGREEVRETGSLVRVLLANRASERLSLFEVGSFRFEPKEVGNVRESESSLQRSLQDHLAH